MKKNKKSSDFDIKWWFWPLIVMGYLQFISLQFWIIYLFVLNETNKKNHQLSFGRRLTKTAFVTGIFLGIILFIGALAGIFS
ncbi:MAG: hypothetical protein PHU51_05725 [Candidatus Nanoarchaeia archaeon]|nr:hypothetical protein [Candidatus Nanoarchaeia archaeon]